MKALIAMSGGVDSSVAALLTQRMGYDCIGCTMKLYDDSNAETAQSRTCCALEDVEDARSVAYRLGMPYYVFNFQEDFRNKVIEKFIRSYESGTTPNPCMDCNRYLKFERLFERARILGCDKIVTGHYARIEFNGKEYVLKKAIDHSKDQSYFLYSMTQEQLSRTLFPLGTLHKTETRQIAEENGFINADKPDSQDICFVPNGDYAAVIKKYTGKRYPTGVFQTPSGEILGKHRGIIHYTVGQRKGLGIASQEALYVCEIQPEKNTIILGNRENLFSRAAVLSHFHWISSSIPRSPFRCSAKIRSRQQEQPVVVYPMENDEVRIVFDQPQRAITPGQAAVLYDGEMVLGGGEIQRADDAL